MFNFPVCDFLWYVIFLCVIVFGMWFSCVWFSLLCDFPVCDFLWFVISRVWFPVCDFLCYMISCVWFSLVCDFLCVIFFGMWFSCVWFSLACDFPVCDFLWHVISCDFLWYVIFLCVISCVWFSLVWDFSLVCNLPVCYFLCVDRGTGNAGVVTSLQGPGPRRGVHHRGEGPP